VLVVLFVVVAVYTTTIPRWFRVRWLFGHGDDEFDFHRVAFAGERVLTVATAAVFHPLVDPVHVGIEILNGR